MDIPLTSEATFKFHWPGILIAGTEIFNVFSLALEVAAKKDPQFEDLSYVTYLKLMSMTFSFRKQPQIQASKQSYHYNLNI